MKCKIQLYLNTAMVITESKNRLTQKTRLPFFYSSPDDEWRSLLFAKFQRKHRFKSMETSLPVFILPFFSPPVSVFLATHLQTQK